MKDPLYQSWKHIQQSLSDWNMKDAERARRLGLDCEWSNFESFRDDIVAALGPKPQNKRLARKDMRKGWHLSNLSYQSYGQISSRQITAYSVRYKGKRLCAKELAKYSSVHYHTVLNRLRKGDSPQRAVRPANAP